MNDCLIAALDVGKTNARLSVIDPHSCTEVWSARRANASVTTALGRELDVAGLETWLIDALAGIPQKERIAAIVPVAHGAAAAFIDRQGDVLAAPDYEDERFAAVMDDYERERDDFGSTYSPSLPLGLNLGRQLFYIERQAPGLFAAAAHLLLYPQFWAWRLSGMMASEVTSLGCHTDLWRPRQMSFSNLSRRRGWSGLFPPTLFAGETAGALAQQLATATGLSPACRIAVGIHDSNCSYLRHLLHRRDQPFAVISSGTWTVVMANHGNLRRLRAEADMLANVDAFGSPVATARFMGGREYEAIAGGSTPASVDALASVIRKEAMALPSFAPGGPFANRAGRLPHADGLAAAERAALATLYVALMCELLLEALDARGDIIIDGPLAANALFGTLLANLRPDNRVLIDNDRGASIAVCYLAGFAQQRPPELTAVTGLDSPELRTYRNAWRDHVAELSSPAGPNSSGQGAVRLKPDPQRGPCK